MANDEAPTGMSSTKVVTIALLCSFYVGVSSLLIRYNKFLMDPSRFPYSMALAAMHMGMSLVCCGIFFLLRPAAFPAMESTAGKRADLIKWFVPIGFTFALSLYASNMAYMYCNVAFLQFMKEGNVIICFLISCAAGLQFMNRVKFGVMMWIVCSSALCVGAEMNFVLFGFLIQLVSQVAECCRVVLGECVLGGSGLKLDPLTYTMFAAPTCLVVLLVGNFFTWDPAMPARAMEHWHLLLPNAMLAFVLNVTVATVIKETSAVGFILTGVTKDIFLVGVSAVIFGEVISSLQVLGFTMILAGVLFWSLMKANPSHHLVRLVEDAMGLPRPGETLPLILAAAKAGTKVPA